MREKINEIRNDDSFKKHISKWELLKFKIREFTIKFSKKLNRKRREYESHLLREISQCCTKPELNDQEKNRVIEVKLDDLYLERAQGTFVRSREKWTEAGEKNTLSFNNLKKSRQQKKSILSLMINMVENKDLNCIEN